LITEKLIKVIVLVVAYGFQIVVLNSGYRSWNETAEADIRTFGGRNSMRMKKGV
jgi:hypothetical protein